MMRKPLLFLLCLSFFLCAAPPASNGEGVPIPPVPREMFSDRMYGFEYFLGPLGGRATLEKPSVAGEGDRLVVTAVLSPGILEHTDLSAGDVIVGVNGSPFKPEEHGVFALMRAYAEAASEKKASFSLLVERKEGRVEIPVKFKGFGIKYSPTAPAKCKRTAAILKRALDWLSEKRRTYDGSGPACSNKNNSRVVVSSVVGLALLASGAKGKSRAAALKKCRCIVLSQVGKEDLLPDKSWSQVNWNLAFGTIFLAELYARKKEPSLKKKLVELAAQIEANQKKTGGWAHGIGGVNGLGYCELNIVGALCVLALACCEKAGVKIDRRAIEKATDYFDRSTPQGCGLGYSVENRTNDAGRSAPAVLAYQVLGMEQDPFPARLAKHFRTHLEQVRHGHGTPSMHLGLAAIASWNMGKKVWDAFWERYRWHVLSVLAPEGCFTWFPTRESRAIGNGDKDMGLCWTTAWNILLLTAPESKLKILHCPSRR